ncbi:MAG: hypothetical protein Ct9H90mP25_1400 [Gammaproteobacteria bacterium]|nr:MAG: hypothetical protein Ct9H90mP25_1400 [Gammaproteobacteria bacterium]
MNYRPLTDDIYFKAGTIFPRKILQPHINWVFLVFIMFHFYEVFNQGLAVSSDYHNHFVEYRPQSKLKRGRYKNVRIIIGDGSFIESGSYNLRMA